MNTKLDLQLEEVFDHPIDAVWRAITDPSRLSRWLMDNDFQPLEGHRFKLREPPTSTWRGWIECQVLELTPPTRMVWSWEGGHGGEPRTRVIFELRQEGASTRLILRHEGEASPADQDSLASGWRRKLGVLSRVLGPDYAQRVAFRSPPERVFDAIATLDGLRGWWTLRVSGSTTPGAEVCFEFDGLDEHVVMRVDRAEPARAVHWTCIEHTELEEWNGTRILFDLARRATGCELTFQHAGLTPRFECYAMCEQGWAHFLRSLAAYVDEGRGTPFGADESNERRGSRTAGARTRKVKHP
jgi:uncharacterized protein YndB with AHSA1/START domain